MPSEETTRPPASRKCSSAARPRQFSAKRFVPSSVAPWLMTGCFLLSCFAAVRAIWFLLVQAEQGAGRRPASFCDKARFFRERKFRLHAGCRRTIVRGAKDFRRDRPLQFARAVPPVESEECVPRSEARRRVAKKRGRTVRRDSRKRRGKRRRFGPPRLAEKLWRVESENSAGSSPVRPRGRPLFFCFFFE